jgi:hypothetical protein
VLLTNKTKRLLSLPQAQELFHFWIETQTIQDEQKPLAVLKWEHNDYRFSFSGSAKGSSHERVNHEFSGNLPRMGRNGGFDDTSKIFFNGFRERRVVESTDFPVMAFRLASYFFQKFPVGIVK